MGFTKKKPVEIKVQEVGTAVGIGAAAPVLHSKIAHTPVDFGREDINNLAKKVNEVIDRLNN